MKERPFRARLETEFAARKQRNPRFSLRAFAAFLETDHSTLSQILRGSRRAPVKQIRTWAKKLHMSAEEAAAYIAAEHLPDRCRRRRENQLHHWTAEAMSILTGRVHWEILRLTRAPGFRPDCRWVAEQIGSTVDEVNVALTRLLRLRLIEINAAGEWLDLTKLPVLKEQAFRNLALARVRERAAL